MADSVASLTADLTLAEKCLMVAGKDTWTVHGCSRLGIPEWTTSDGPVGARGRLRGPGLVMPAPSALAATWNTEVVALVGSAIATECIDRRVDLLLAPTVNLHRSPRGGRHFECFSEDPLLSARMAVAYINGVQNQGVGACVKHFILNDQETDRTTIDATADQRTLREVHLAPFEAAVTEAGVRAVMGSYNYVNGDHACAHRRLLVDILKTEWGFDGLVVSDWSATKDTIGPACGGLDLEMPGPGEHWGADQLLAAVHNGDVPEADIDDKVRRILGFLDWRGRLPGESDHEEQTIERPEHRSLARRAATEAMVLVRNEGALLPLGAQGSVALIGPALAELSIQGGGSARLEPHRSPSLLGALASRLGHRLAGHMRGPSLSRLPARIRDEWLAGESPVVIEAYDSAGFDGPCVETIRTRMARKFWIGDTVLEDVAAFSVRETITIEPPASGPYAITGLGMGDVTLLVDGERVARSGTDGHGDPGHAAATVELSAGRTHEIILESVFAHKPRYAGVDVRIEAVVDDFEATCAAAEAMARSAETAVMAVGTTHEWESEGSDRGSLDLPARQSELVARVLAANPNTVVVLNCGAPVETDWFSDAPCVLLAWFPGQEGADAIADVLLGDAEPGGRMPTTWARRESDTPSFGHYPGRDGEVHYTEGLFVGHRHYDRAGTEPLIPFGHGMSYTRFDWEAAAVRGSGVDWSVDVPVTNTGTRSGSAVVQVYVGPDPADPHRPPRQLAGFAKLALDPSERAVAQIAVAPRAFASWDVATGRWITRPGRYTLSVAASAADIRSARTIDVD